MKKKQSQARVWENTKYKSDKGLVSIIKKEPLQLNSKKTNKLILKMIKRSEYIAH